MFTVKELAQFDLEMGAPMSASTCDDGTLASGAVPLTGSGERGTLGGV